MTAGIRLTHDEVMRRFADAGLALLTPYSNQYGKVEARCLKHNEVHPVLPTNIFKGQRLSCCGNEGRSVKHTGKVVSAETRSKLSAMNTGELSPRFGRSLSADERKRVSDGLKRAARSSVDYAIKKAATGKTAGKPGHFYIAKTGDGFIKFGSIVRLSPSQRMQFLRAKTGAAELLLLAKVDDAGAYEAAMLNAHRAHWSHGEHFHASVLSS